MIGILNAIVQLLVMLLCIRFHTSGYFLPNNHLVKGLRRITDPLVLPFNRLFLPKRFDRAALLVGLLLSVLFGLVATKALWAGLMVGGLKFVLYWADLVFYCILISVVASWLQTPPHQPVLQIVYSCSEWYMAPIRKYVPKLTISKESGMQLDFSPIIGLLGIVLLNGLVANFATWIFAQ